MKDDEETESRVARPGCEPGHPPLRYSEAREPTGTGVSLLVCTTRPRSDFGPRLAGLGAGLVAMSANPQSCSARLCPRQ